jgi:formylglycine-generating enzyme required for sulfatase activity
MKRLALVPLAALACNEAPPRPEVVFHVDTDMPLLALVDDTTSADAAIDTLRIEIYDEKLETLDARVLSIASKADLPLSFSIPADVVDGGQVLVRVRAFRALFSSPGLLNGRPVLDPRPEVTVDRLVSIQLPAEGVEARSITLRGDCIGVPAKFAVGALDAATCIDGKQLNGHIDEGVSTEIPTSSLVGTWSAAAITQCSGEPPPGARCIPGGFLILGDTLYVARNELDLDSVPLRPVVLSPFYLGETEVTVGMVRSLVTGGYTDLLPEDGPTIGPKCTWDAATAGDMPLNCVSYEVADALCKGLGGTVPTEAQWEHAARGRGERRLYAWGNDAPQCCAATIGRVAGGGCEVPNAGPDPVATHLGGPDCVGDVSRDEILDLVGSVVELTSDSATLSFDDPCWTPGPGSAAILRDPHCLGGTRRVARGGGWAFTLGDGALPIRRPYLERDPGHGFRCAFAEEP